MRNPVCNRRVLSVEWLVNWNFHVRARCSQSVQKRALCHSFLATTTFSSFWKCLNLYEFSLGHGNNWALGALAWTVLDVLKFQEILISSILPLLENTSVKTWKCFHCRFFHWGIPYWGLLMMKPYSAHSDLLWRYNCFQHSSISWLQLSILVSSVMIFETLSRCNAARSLCLELILVWVQLNRQVPSLLARSYPAKCSSCNEHLSVTSGNFTIH